MAKKGLVVVVHFGLEVAEDVDDVLDPEHKVVFTCVKA